MCVCVCVSVFGEGRMHLGGVRNFNGHLLEGEGESDINNPWSWGVWSYNI